MRAVTDRNPEHGEVMVRYACFRRGFSLQSAFFACSESVSVGRVCVLVVGVRAEAEVYA